ncbi:tetrahydrofolate dehydrogenase/cyclohydrolase, catalytic domain protein [Ancylostoma duodenale]|uniref:Tetrahydrofolate dehydrogenase/cyclohydrolase, catalytic domain protein n=1 Tax=Ancylostoma duodenale TaxID=51022 RepID=A0A0C2DKP1_9BILA|nr:tetrahydrofolate dehydrogenase/cyclohydrolase, catalytic domain protein [Ancylostoma duodenale]
MVAQLISGTEISKQLLSEVAEKLKKRKESNSSFRVVLAIVQVGDRSDSNVYIGAKIKKAAEIGAEGRLIKLPDTLTQAELEEEIEKLNANDDVDGIIVQIKKAAEIGAEGRLIKLPDTLTQAELEEEIEKLNADDDVDGIIVQR